jgi:hypothetical protein
VKRTATLGLEINGEISQYPTPYATCMMLMEKEEDNQEGQISARRLTRFELFLIFLEAGLAFGGGLFINNEHHRGVCKGH